MNAMSKSVKWKESAAKKNHYKSFQCGRATVSIEDTFAFDHSDGIRRVGRVLELFEKGKKMKAEATTEPGSTTRPHALHTAAQLFFRRCL